MNNYRIVQFKNTNLVGIAEIKPIWWQRLFALKVDVLVPQLSYDFLDIDLESWCIFSLTKPDYSEPIVQDLSKVGDLIIKAEKLKNRIKLKEVEIADWKIDFPRLISRGVDCNKLQKSIEQMKQEVIQLQTLEKSLDNLIFSAIGDSLRARATEEFKQIDKSTYDRSNTIELVNEIECQIQAYKTLFEQNSLAQSSSKTADLDRVNATKLV